MPNWYQFQQKATIRVVSTDYALPVGDVVIQAVPYLGSDAESVGIDIAGEHFTRFTTQRWHMHVALSWGELAAYHWPTLYDCIDDMANNVGTGTIYYSLVNPYDATKAFEVIPLFTPEMIGVVYRDQGRRRGAQLALRSKATVSTLPTWLQN